MDLSFDMVKAQSQMTNFLFREKGYCEKNIGNYPGIQERIDNIQMILNDSTLLEKMVAIELTSDVDYIVGHLSQNNDCEIDLKGLLASCISGKMVIIPGKGLSIDVGFSGNTSVIYFSTSEELRKFLYELVGFVFQSKEEVKNNPHAEIVDPMSLPDFKSNHAFSLLDDLNSIRNVVVPELKNVQVQK